MVSRNKIAVVLAVYAFTAMTFNARISRADLERYVRRPEAAFAWQVKSGSGASHAEERVYDLHLVSQVWLEKRWEHQLQVYRPAGGAPNRTMFLWVTGGSARADYIALGRELARKIGAPVAFLYHVPNQPLLEGNLYEDDLIAETFVRYLTTKDENWPLLFPMVKSVTKAMDALQAFASKEFGQTVNKFIVSGASKRGWTTWLTAAVDERVAAIAPAVIDTLNMRSQMRRQLEVFGAYSSRLAAYSSRGLLPIPDTPEGQRLLSMVDPWAYRGRLTMPKLIINGTNDFYWATDALNLYWNDIPADKWVLYIPNAGHSLRRQDRPQAEQLNDLIDGLAAFSRHQISGVPMPNLRWKHETAERKALLTITATPPPVSARLWIARSATADFRTAAWSRKDVSMSAGEVVGEVSRPNKGRLAFFGELDYEIDGLRYRLSTQVGMTD